MGENYSDWISTSLTYVNWNEPGETLPLTHRISHYMELSQKRDKFLFARKFDTEVDFEILDKIDDELLK